MLMFRLSSSMQLSTLLLSGLEAGLSGSLATDSFSLPLRLRRCLGLPLKSLFDLFLWQR